MPAERQLVWGEEGGARAVRRLWLKHGARNRREERLYTHALERAKNNAKGWKHSWDLGVNPQEETASDTEIILVLDLMFRTAWCSLLVFHVDQRTRKDTSRSGWTL